MGGFYAWTEREKLMSINSDDFKKMTTGVRSFEITDQEPKVKNLR
ncbi:MAG: hypothetical protein ACI9W6_000036 [Motiliproteus sp.]|jgi:hypothetical protein